MAVHFLWNLMRPIRLLGPCAALLLTGCATAPSNDTAAPASTPSPATADNPAAARLEQRAAAERPDGDFPEAPLPPGLDGESVARRPADDLRSRADLAEALASVVLPEPPAEVHHPPQSPTARRRAEQLFLQGRELFLQGRFSESLEILEQARTLDPGATAVLRLMARAHLESTGPGRAIPLFEGILAQDQADLEARYHFAVMARQQGDALRAAGHLAVGLGLLPMDAQADAPSLETPDPEADVALWLLCIHDLGLAFRELGHDAAALQCWRPLQLQAEYPTHCAAAPREWQRFRRQRVAHLVEIGDASLRLGRPAEALEIYRQAEMLPLINPQALVPRILYAALRSGMEHTALLRLYRLLADPATPPAQAGLAEFAAEIPSADLLAEALRRQCTTGEDVAVHTVVAAAELSDRRQAERLFRDFLAGPSGSRSEVRLELVAWGAQNRSAEAVWDVLLAEAERIETIPDLLVEEAVAVAGTADFLLESPGPDDDWMPLLRAALLLRQGAPQEALEVMADGESHSAGRLLRARALAMQLQRDLARDELRRIDKDGHSSADFALAVAEACTNLGLAGEAHEWLGVSTSGDATEQSEDLRRRSAIVLVELGRLFEAQTLLTRLTESPQPQPWAARLLLDLYGPAGPLSDPERYVTLARRLASDAPQSALAAEVRARQDLYQGSPANAAAGFAALVASNPRDETLVRLLIESWIGAGLFDEAEGWLRAARQQRPGDDALRNHWVSLLLAREQLAEADDFLAACLDENPYAEWAAQRRVDVLFQMDREGEAMAFQRRRLDLYPPSADRSLRLVRLALLDADYTAALTGLEDAVGLAGEHLDAHLLQIVTYARELGSRDAQRADEASRFIEQTIEHALTLESQLSVSLWSSLIDAAVLLDRDLTDLKDFYARALDQHPQRGRELARRLVERLVLNDRPDDAVAIFQVWLDAGHDLLTEDAPLVSWRLREAVRREEPEVIVDLFTRADEEGILPSIALNEQWLPLDRLEDALVEMSQIFSTSGNDAASEALLEAALEVDPDHPTANNNLGYALADRGERLEEAEAMILRAHEQEPEIVAYQDSLGWVRYKRGILEDIPGDPPTPGALSLLETAARNPQDGDDPVILDHLGDVYWRLGRQEDAIATWERVVRIYENLVQQFNDNLPEQLDLLADAYGPVADGAREKVNAARRGDPPPVAPSPALDEPAAPGR